MHTIQLKIPASQAAWLDPDQVVNVDALGRIHNYSVAVKQAWEIFSIAGQVVTLIAI